MHNLKEFRRSRTVFRSHEDWRFIRIELLLKQIPAKVVSYEHHARAVVVSQSKLKRATERRLPGNCEDSTRRHEGQDHNGRILDQFSKASSLHPLCETKDENSPDKNE